jgi:L-lactate permease
MSQSLIYTLLALLLLLGGIFMLRRMWMGALAGVLFLGIAHVRAAGLTALFPAAADALLIWAELGLLIFGAYLFYNLLHRQKQMEAFHQKAGASGAGLSVVLLFGWFLGSLMEGIAGFGIPAMLVAPLLYSFGFRPLTCVIIPLAANTASVTFGALATALRIGIGVTLPTDAVVQYTVLLNILPIMAMPFMLAWLYSRTEGISLSWRSEWQTLLLAGVCFLIPYLIGSRISVELPTVLAGSIGMFAFVALAMPKGAKPPALLWWRSFWPYLLFITLLIPASSLLKPIGWQWVEGGKKFSAFQPGLLFIIAGIIYQSIAVAAGARKGFLYAWQETVSKIRMTLFSILLLVLFTQLIRTDMAAAYSELSPQQPWMVLIVFPGISGVMGSFITGSATMGNLLFAGGLKQLLTGQQWMMLALAVLHSGSAVGNAISLQNVLMVKSIIPDEIEEARIVQTNAPVVLVYMLLVCLVAWLVMNV